MIFIGWIAGGYFAIGVLVALCFFAVISYREGKLALGWDAIGTYAYITVAWPMYVIFALAIWLFSR